MNLPFRSSSLVTVCFLICKITFVFLFIVPASKAVVINGQVTSNGVVSYVLPTITWTPSERFPALTRIYFGLIDGRFPIDVTTKLSCNINMKPLEESNHPPLYFNLTLVQSNYTQDNMLQIDEIAYPVRIDGNCILIITNHSEDVKTFDNLVFSYIGVYVSQNNSITLYNNSVTGKLDGAINCSVNVSPNTVRFTGTPDEYVEGITKHITLITSCGDRANIRASSSSSSSSSSDGVCRMVNNSTSDNGQLKLCVEYNGQPLPLDFSDTLSLLNGAEDIAVTMSADHISSVYAGEYSTQLFIVVSPD